MSILTKTQSYLSNYVALNNASLETLKQTPSLLFIQQGGSKFADILMFKKFGYATNNTYQKSSEISNHFTEDNVTMSDHWAIKPTVYTLSGLIGEVVFTPPKSFTNKVNSVIPNWLDKLGFFAPTVSQSVTLLRASASQIESTINRYTQLAAHALQNYSPSVQAQSNQQYLTSIFDSLINNRQLITIWTPFKTLENMAIVDYNISQSDTKYVAQVELRLQQWSFVGTQTRKATESEKALLVEQQTAETVNQGTASTTNVPRDSSLYSITVGRNQ